MINDSENSSLTNKRRSLDLALIFNDNLPTPTYTYVPSTRDEGTKGGGQLPHQIFVSYIEAKYFLSKCLGLLLAPSGFSRVSYGPEYERLKLDLASLEQNVSRRWRGAQPCQSS